MQRIKRKSLIQKVFMLVAVCVFILCIRTGDVAMAAENESLPPFDSSWGTLTVSFEADDGYIVPNATIKIVQVAEVEVVDGKAKFTSTSGFEEAEVNYIDMTASDSNLAAKNLYKIATQNRIVTDSKQTGTDGKAKFTGLNYGIYLVYLQDRVASGDKSYGFDPFLVMVPETVTNVDNQVTAWESDAVAAPKAQDMNKIPNVPPDEEETPPDKDVNTGDDARLLLWVILAVVSTVLLIANQKILSEE